MARFCPLFSSSAGNCTYIGTNEGGVLVDAGVSARRIQQALTDRNIDVRLLKAVFVTHEHGDHVAGLRVLQQRYGFPVYASRGTLDALYNAGTLGDDALCFAMPQVVDVAGLEVRAFRTSHDSAESLGFCFESGDGRRMAVATDMGRMLPQEREILSGCDLILMESNHDVRMLENGPYPYYLKQRILSQTGHLSNDDCAAELTGFVRLGATRLFLAHLSRQNNLPQLAFLTAQRALAAMGMREQVDYLLQVAEPVSTRPVLVF